MRMFIGFAFVLAVLLASTSAMPGAQPPETNPATTDFVIMAPNSAAISPIMSMSNDPSAMTTNAETRFAGQNPLLWRPNVWALAPQPGMPSDYAIISVSSTKTGTAPCAIYDQTDGTKMTNALADSFRHHAPRPVLLL